MSTQVISDVAEIEEFAAEVADLVGTGMDEPALTKAVAVRLDALLKAGFRLPEAKIAANPEHYVMYPLHVAADGSFSIAAAVWDVGQSTPVHGHETWGVVGIYSGVEHEIRYHKPPEPGVSLVRGGVEDWQSGQVTVCCTTDDDIHQVSCGGAEPCVGIHVYGADIGTLPRRRYDPSTGDVAWFTSTWS